jgi:hypothetical protein
MIRKRALEFGAQNAGRHSGSSAIVMHDERVLSSKEFLHDLAVFYGSLDRSRRTIPDWITDQLSLWSGGILETTNREFKFEDETVDAAFNHEGSFRWLSDFTKFATEPPRQRAQARVIERLKVMSVAAAIHEHLEMQARRHAADWLAKYHPSEAIGEYDPASIGHKHRFCRHVGPRGFTNATGWDRMVARMQAIMNFAERDEDRWLFELVLPFLQDEGVRSELGL